MYQTKWVMTLFYIPFIRSHCLLASLQAHTHICTHCVLLMLYLYHDNNIHTTQPKPYHTCLWSKRSVSISFWCVHLYSLHAQCVCNFMLSKWMCVRCACMYGWNMDFVTNKNTQLSIRCNTVSSLAVYQAISHTTCAFQWCTPQLNTSYKM